MDIAQLVVMLGHDLQNVDLLIPHKARNDGAYNSSTLQVEAELQGYPHLLNKFEAKSRYIKNLIFKKKEEEEEEEVVVVEGEEEEGSGIVSKLISV